MTIAELLLPRFVQRINYPKQAFKAGHIYVKDALSLESDEDWCAWYKEFPEVFTQIKWWRYRNPEDMPLFLKTKNGCFKIDKWGTNMFGDPTPYITKEIDDEEVKRNQYISVDWHFRDTNNILPCTEEEYLANQK